MDLEYILRKERAAREYTIQVGPSDAPRSIQMRLPTEHELRLAGARSRVGVLSDAEATIAVERELLCLAVVGWAGVLCSDLLAASAGTAQGVEPFAFEPGAVAPLLDANPQWSGILWNDILGRIVRRGEQREEHAKNSGAASTGSDPEAMRPT